MEQRKIKQYRKICSLDAVKRCRAGAIKQLNRCKKVIFVREGERSDDRWIND